MNDLASVNAILNFAIEREQESYAFYSDVARRVHDQLVRDTFKQLAKDELGHKEFIKKCIEDQNLLRNLPVPQDYKVAEATEGPAFSTDMKPKDSIALAMKKEQGAAELYSKLAACAADLTYRDTFKRLATMELGHKTCLEAIFMEVGYPEVW